MKKHYSIFNGKSCTKIWKKMNFSLIREEGHGICTRSAAEAARKAAAEHMAALRTGIVAPCRRIFPELKIYIIQRHERCQPADYSGPVCFTHTLFRSCKDGTCHYLLDE